MIRVAAGAVAWQRRSVVGGSEPRRGRVQRASWSASRSPGPWVAIPAPGGLAPRRAGGSSARRASSEASMPAPARRRSPSSSPGGSAAPSIPGITTTRSLVFRGTYAGRVARPRATGRSSGASRRRGWAAHADRASGQPSRQAGRADHDPRHDARVVEPGRSPAKTLACRARRASAAGEPQRRASTRRACLRAAELAAVHVVRVRPRRGRSWSAPRGAGSPAGVRAEVQIYAECAR